jgi:hypothetical protein
MHEVEARGLTMESYPFQPLFLPNAKQQRKATFVAAHRYGIWFVGLVLILHDA